MSKPEISPNPNMVAITRLLWMKSGGIKKCGWLRIKRGVEVQALCTDRA
jgi:hypothetical protein